MPFLAAPLALLGLTLAPALVAIYLLRNRARRLEVSSLIFFPRAPEASAGGRKLRRPTAPLLLLLELLAVALLVLAAARPAVEGALSGRPLALVLDDSLSMRAGGGESARARAIDWLSRELASTRHRPLVLVLAGRRPAALGRPARRGDDALARLPGWRCADAEARLAEAVALARELAGPRARTVVLTDRLPGPEDAVPADAEVLALGTARPNLAVVDAARGRPDERSGAETVQVQVASFAVEARAVAVTLEELSAAGPRPLATSSLSLGPLERRRLAFSLPAGASVVRVRLPEDALPDDDSVLLAPAPSRRVSAEVRLTDAPARQLIESALGAALPATFSRAVPRGGAPLHLVFLDGVDARVPPDPGTWRCVVRSRAAGGLSHAGPFVLDRRSPLLWGVSLDGVVWGSPADVPAGAGGPVVLAGETTLLSDEERPDGGRDLQLAFVPSLSTLQATPAFPALVANLLAYRAAELPGPERPNVRAGEEVTVRVAAGTSSVVAVLPDGRRREVPVSARRATLVAEEPGLHFVGAHPIAVNVLAEGESDLLRAESRMRGGVPADEKVARGARDVAWALGLLALGVLALHRMAFLSEPEAAS